MGATTCKMQPVSSLHVHDVGHKNQITAIMTELKERREKKKEGERKMEEKSPCGAVVPQGYVDAFNYDWVVTYL